VGAWGGVLLGFAMGAPGVALYSYRVGFRTGVRNERVRDMGWPTAWPLNAAGTAFERYVDRQPTPRRQRDRIAMWWPR
jgi:hypothetical protein